LGSAEDVFAPVHTFGGPRHDFKILLRGPGKGCEWRPPAWIEVWLEVGSAPAVAAVLGDTASEGVVTFNTFLSCTEVARRPF